MIPDGVIKAVQAFRKANDVMGQGLSKVGQVASESFLYDPETKRPFPRSPLYPENQNDPTAVAGMVGSVNAVRGVMAAENVAKSGLAKTAQNIVPNKATSQLGNMGRKYSDDLIAKIKNDMVDVPMSENRAVVIDSDMVKKAHPNYIDKDAPLFHEDSSKIAKDLEKIAIQNDISGKYKMTAGGSGSGKSEVILDRISNEPSVISDGTLANFDSATKKIDYALKNGKQVEIHAVYTPIQEAWQFAKSRARNVPQEVFMDKHKGFRETMPKLLEKYGDKIDMKIYQNGYSTGRGGRLLDFPNKQDLLEFIKREADVL